MALIQLLLSVVKFIAFFFQFPFHAKERARTFRERGVWYMIITEFHLWLCGVYSIVMVGYIILYLVNPTAMLAELAPYVEWGAGIMGGLLLVLGCMYALGINSFAWHTDLDSELDEYRREDVASERLEIHEWKEQHAAFRAWKTWGTKRAPYTARTTNWYNSVPEDVFRLPYREWYAYVRKDRRFRKWEKEHNARYRKHHFEEVWRGFRKSLEY